MENLNVKNVVLVHGAFADGSGFKALYNELTKKGYNVSVVQNPLTSLEDDVLATHVALDRIGGPAILAGHSWGGAVITEAGNHPNVVALVYIAAFQPDNGESALIATEDKSINPDIQRTMYSRSNTQVIEVKGSHVIFMSQPKIVAGVIIEAAEKASAMASVM